MFTSLITGNTCTTTWTFIFFHNFLSLGLGREPRPIQQYYLDIITQLFQLIKEFSNSVETRFIYGGRIDLTVNPVPHRQFPSICKNYPSSSNDLFPVASITQSSGFSPCRIRVPGTKGFNLLSTFCSIDCSTGRVAGI